MSDEVLGHEEALAAAHACFEGDVLVEGYILIAAGIEAETGQRVWAVRTDESSSAFTTIGLAFLARQFLDAQACAMLECDDDG